MVERLAGLCARWSGAVEAINDLNHKQSAELKHNEQINGAVQARSCYWPQYSQGGVTVCKAVLVVSYDTNSVKTLNVTLSPLLSLSHSSHSHKGRAL